MIWISAYIVQLVIGIFIWKRVLFDKGNLVCFLFSILFSAILIPNLIYVLAFLIDKVTPIVEETPDDIICTGNNGNGCFMDSCAIDCGCEGLEKFKNKKL